MALPEMQVPLPEIGIEAKRELPGFVAEEQRALLRIAHPGVRRPVKPSYAFIRQRTIDLNPPQTTEDIELWSELRRGLLSQTNHPRWAGSIAVGNEFHTVGWFSVVDSGVKEDHFCTLRCSCCLPAFDEPDSQAYEACEAKDSVIEDRAKVFRDLLGTDGLDTVPGGLEAALAHTVADIKNDSLIWPPSHRSDALLVEGLALSFGVSPKKVLDAALSLQAARVLEIQDSERPILKLAA